MRLSFIIIEILLLSVITLAATKQQGIESVTKINEELLRILEDRKDDFQKVVDRMGDMVDIESLGECIEFKEPISIQISNLPGLFSMNELEWVEDTVEAFLRENIDELGELDVHVVRQMEEKQRGDGDENNVLILLDIYGCYEDRLNQQALDVQKKVEEEKNAEEIEEKKDAALSMAIEQQEQKKVEAQKNLEEQQKLEEEQKKLEEQQKLQEESKLEQQKLEEKQIEDQKQLEEQHKLEAEQKKEEVVGQIVNQVQEGLEQKQMEEQQKLEAQQKLQAQQKLEAQQELEAQQKLQADQKLKDEIEEGDDYDDDYYKHYTSGKSKYSHSRTDYSKSRTDYSKSRTDYSKSRTDYSYSRKGKGKGGAKGRQSIMNVKTSHPMDIQTSHSQQQIIGYSSSFSKYNSHKSDYVTLPPQLKLKLQSVLSRSTPQNSLLPRLKHISDPYFSNITSVEFIRGAFPKGFDETQLQAYSEYVTYEEIASEEEENVSSGNTVIINAIVGISVFTLILIASVFLYVTKQKSKKKDIMMNKSIKVKHLKLDIDSYKYRSSSKTMASSTADSTRQWKNNSDDTSTINSSNIKPSRQEQITSSKGTGLATSSKGTGLSSNFDNNNIYREETPEYYEDNESDCSSYVNEFRGECYAPPGKLGVVLDSVNGSPVVHRLKPGSPLDGVLQIMDRIIGIDEVDTSRMSAPEVTKVMVSKMRQNRKITYIRGNFAHGVHDDEEQSFTYITENASM